jgi:hypothetical protein
MNAFMDRPLSRRYVFFNLITWLCLFLIGATVCIAQKHKVPMTPDGWTVMGQVTFEHHDGRDAIVMLPGNQAQGIPSSQAILKNLRFRDGTIEYDVEATAGMGAGVAFRRQDEDNYELFYLRPKPNCNRAEDCMQYAPQVKGALLWDVFPQYQTPGPLHEGWNHIRMVVAGKRMNIFVNGEVTPSMQIGRLEGDVTDGELMLEGPGTFSNIVVTPGVTAGLSSQPVADATAGDPRYIRHWELSPYRPIAQDAQTPARPSQETAWKPLAAERAGFVNVSRQYGLILPRSQSNIVWLKTTIHSTADQQKQVKFGWVREAWVYVNGKLVYADKNLYQPAAARKSPDGRMSLQNGGFALPLKVGDNEVMVGLVNNFYGWGLTMRLDDLKGVRLAAH